MLIGSKRALLLDSGDYLSKVKTLFGSSIIGYWPMDEPSGDVAFDYSGNAYHGAYTGVTLGAAGIGDGRTCPFYDGANDYNLLPAGFRTAFTPTEFTVLIWYWPVDATPWTDGSVDYAVRIGVDANNSVNLFKSATNGVFNIQYVAGGTSDAVSLTSQSFIVPACLGITVSVSADALKAYKNGIQQGTTQNTLGTWVGTPAATLTLAGASATTPTNPCNGYLAHLLVLNRAATAAEMLAVANL